MALGPRSPPVSGAMKDLRAAVAAAARDEILRSGPRLQLQLHRRPFHPAAVFISHGVSCVRGDGAHEFSSSAHAAICRLISALALSPLHCAYPAARGAVGTSAPVSRSTIRVHAADRSKAGERRDGMGAEQLASATVPTVW